MTGYAYDDAGRMTTATLPSGTGIVSTYSYDDADRLTNIAHVKGGSTTIASVAYTLDDVGNRTQRVDQQGTHTYAYDDLYRLTSVTYPGPSTTSYAFDAFGNRTSMTVAGNTTTYAYDDNDRITSVTPPSPASVINYTWDDNGDLTARGSDSFSWDYEDRMVSATVNSVTTSFAYRGDGLRDSRTVGGNTTSFTWDIARGLPVVLDDGNQYVYGAALAAQKQGGSWYYYLADGLGSTMAVVNASGAVQDSYTYDVYGTPTKTGSLANEFDFGGQQTDETGLQYLRARYMDPATGTFLSRDPMAGDPGWIGSPMTYGKSSPTQLTDPSGLREIEGCECQENSAPPGWVAPAGRWFERRDDGYYLCGMPDPRLYATPPVPYCDKFDPAVVDSRPTCSLCDDITSAVDAGITIFTIGEYTFRGTNQFRDTMRAYGWGQSELDDIKSGTLYKDRYGHRVWTKARADGTTDVLVASKIR